MEPTEPIECPFCFEHMQLEARDETAWMVCPNGCPTEVEVPIRKPAESADTPLRASAAKS